MESSNLRCEQRVVGAFRGHPVVEEGLGGFAVRQAVGDGEAGVTLQLGEDHQHLPVEKAGLSAPPRGESQLSPTPRLCLGPAPLRCHHLLPHADPLLPPLPTPHLCRGGTLSCVLRLPRVETTLKLSVQSHWTCR